MYVGAEIGRVCEGNEQILKEIECEEGKYNEMRVRQGISKIEFIIKARLQKGFQALK